MRFSKFSSLQSKFIIISVINIIIPLILVVGLSYSKSIKLIKEQMSVSNLRTVEQVSENISMMFQDMESSSVYLLQNEEFMDYLRLPRKEIYNNPGHLLSAQKFINNYLAFNTNIHSIYLEGFNGLKFDSESAQNTISPKIRRQLIQLRGEGLLLPDMITNYDGTQTKVFSYIKIIKDTEDLSSDLAILKINLPESAITDIFVSNLLNDNSNYFIVDDENQLISSINPLPEKNNFSENLLRPYTALSSDYYYQDINEQEYVITYCNLKYPSWVLYNLIPLEDLSADITIIRNFTLLSIICSLLICTFIIFFFSIKVFSPLKTLRKAMFQLENENFDVNIDIKGHDEIALLADSFNKMSRKLDALVNEVLAVQIKQKEAELKALQMQINPHFLYNTLDMIYWKARMENAPDSASLVKTLSGLFRLTLTSGNAFTSLEKEVQHLRLYIEIQEKRFEGKVSFVLNVQDGLDDLKVVKLTLQPLVENAIKHGVEKNNGEGIIQIEILKEKDLLLYIIQDNGVGADADQVYSYLNKVEPNNQGLALNNVHARIQAYFGNEYGLSFETAPGSGMTVRVLQPVVRYEEKR